MRFHSIAGRLQRSRNSRWIQSAAALCMPILLAGLPCTPALATPWSMDSMMVQIGTPAPPMESGLGGFPDVEGHPHLPPSLGGSVNPMGDRIVSVESDALRFSQQATKISFGNDRTDVGGIGNGCNGLVWAVAVSEMGEVYVGGSFTVCGNARARNIARFDPIARSWTSLGSGTANGVNGAVFAIAVSGDTVYAGGSFSEAGDAQTSRIARFETKTRTWSSLGSDATNGVNGVVHALAISDNTVYAGGGFTQAGGAPANLIARFDTTTQGWSSLGNGISGEQVRALAVYGGMVYVGGAFTQAGGAPANRVARFDATTQTWASLGSGTANGMNDAVLAITTSGSMVYAGGIFTQAGGAPANQVARFDTTTQTWASLGSGVAGGSAVSALAHLGRTVYAGGLFSQAGGATANHIARFDTVDQTWASLGSGADNGVNAPVAGLAATTDGVLYLGGSFDLAFGQVSPGVARYNAEQIFGNGFE